MDFLMLLAGMLTGAAVATVLVFGWAAGELRWLATHCHQHIAYWREETERAKATVVHLRDQLAAERYNRPGP